MCDFSATKLIIDGAVAFGTVAVAILAIWGSPKKHKVFEVAWDGKWSYERATMANRLTIREIESPA